MLYTHYNTCLPFKQTRIYFRDRMVSCLLKHLTRKIKSNIIRRLDVSNIIIKNGENF